jgi:hypothetical protein
MEDFFQNHVKISPTSVRMATIKNTHNNTFWQKWEKAILISSWWECKLVPPLWKTAWIFLKKLKTELPYDPAISLLCIYPKETKSMTKSHLHSYAHCSTIHSSREMKTTQVFVS